MNSPAHRPVGDTGPAALSPLEARGLCKHFLSGDGSELRILQGVELRMEPGEVVAVIGASGVGKSTLLHLLGALDRPTAGDVLVGGRSLSEMDQESLAAVRNRHIGFVFQFHHLLRDFSALENVAFPRADRRSARRATPRIGPGTFWPPWACPTGSTTCPPSCPGGSNNASPSPVPWPTTL